MKINGCEVDVRKFTWAEPGGELHIDILKLMLALGIPWSEENERNITRDIVTAFARLAPEVPITHLVDRKPPGKPPGN